MRLTIVDVQMGVVRDVLQVATVTAETFAQVVEWAAQYRNEGYRWLVSPNGEMPRHAQHDDFGRCVVDDLSLPFCACGRPWSRCDGSRAKCRKAVR